MSQTYNSGIGISEATASSRSKALKMIGQRDENGDTIGIVHINPTVFQVIPFAIRAFVYVFIVACYYLQHPFGWLSIFGWSRLNFLINLEVFTTLTWWLVFLFYSLYFLFCYLRNVVISGVEGVDIHCQKNDEICKTVSAGEVFFCGPLTKPVSVVFKQKNFPLIMNKINGKTGDQHTIYYDSALVFRAIDTYTLVVKEGFQPFIVQLMEFYQSFMNDTIIGIKGDKFATFQVDTIVSQPVSDETDFDQISTENLSVELLSKLSTINEMDMSKIDLIESQTPERFQLIAAINSIANIYGLECIDHIPLGTAPKDSFFEEKAITLATILERLSQSVLQLRSIIEDGADAEISLIVESREVGVLEIEQIIKDMQSITASLKDSENVQSIVESKQASIVNKVEAMIGPVMLMLEGLQAQISSKIVENTGIERYRNELDDIFDEINANLEVLIPDIQNLTISDMNEDSLIPEIDIVELILKKTGTQKVLNNLKGDVRAAVKEVETEKQENTDDTAKLLKDLEQIDIDSLMNQVQDAISAIMGDLGISTKGFTLEEVEKKIVKILEKTDIKDELSDEASEELPIIPSAIEVIVSENSEESE